jgi:hypothetical protein
MLAGMPYLSRPKPRTSADLIVEECDALKALLLEKNASYGDSALDPIRVFSRADPIEQLRVSIDHKLSRIARADPTALGEDAVFDLLGYLVLFRIATRRRAAELEAIRMAKASPPTLSIRQEIDAARASTIDLLTARGVVRSRDQPVDSHVFASFVLDALDALADVLDPPSPAPLDEEVAR